MARVIIAGATGAVGSALVDTLKADDRCEHALALVRRPVDLGVETAVIDFDAMEAHRAAFAGRGVALCCLGTTIAAVGGDRAAFRRVDHDYPLAFFQLAADAGARQLSLITAAGASPRSPGFYSRTKGEVEEGARKIAAEAGARLTILRPAMLLTPGGERDAAVLGGRNTRTVEHLAQRALLSGGWLLGPLKQQVAVSVAVLARAMWRDALAGGEPVTVLSNRQIIALGGQ
jgi:uncharacterized protein YbjT (DUF2867 family)